MKLKTIGWLTAATLTAAAACGTAIGAGDSSPAGTTTSGSATATKAAAPLDAAARATTAPQAPIQAAGPAAAFDGGTYEVGVDIQAGQYKTAGPADTSVWPYCYYARMKDDSGELNAIIANDNTPGPASVRLKTGEFVKTNGCLPWQRTG